MEVIKNPSKSIWSELIRRPEIERNQLNQIVSDIISNVKENGDRAIYEYTAKFDKAKLSSLLVTDQEIEIAKSVISKELKDAIAVAKRNIEIFHKSQESQESIIETTAGVKCWRKSVGIEKVGLYIPGGSAPLFSTILMLAIPAKLAGCSEIILCTPPDSNGVINPAILYTATLIGVTKIFKVGGAQAIAAMTYGTETITQVYKIFGPGNQFVTKAKELVQQNGVAIDMPAGPSEVLIIADDSCNASFVASDLLSQAEHGADSQVILLSNSEDVISQVNSELEKQVIELPRSAVAQQALSNSSSILLDNIPDCIEFSNQYAPEHLIIASDNSEEYVDQIINAGSVFLGNYSCESAGDYASGTNHTLPTNGFARNYSGVSLDSFVRKITFQKINEIGIQTIGPSIEIMAEAEQLFAHKNAVTLRLKEIQMVNIKDITRKNVLEMSPYSSARNEYKGTANVWLDANENPNETGLNRYPDPLQMSLKKEIAELRGIKQERIFISNGSDEIIDLLFRAFCEPGSSKGYIFPPTYGMYQVCAAINNIEIVEIPLNEQFEIPPMSEIRDYISTPGLLFICSPNNPTGNSSSTEEIARIAESFNGIVVIDEAYIDFSEQESAISLLNKNANIIILQTFSKAYGLAGARVGMAFSNPEIIAVLNKIKPPYNVNTLSINAALEVLSANERIQLQIAKIKLERELICKELIKLEIVKKVYPSDTNFLLVKFVNEELVFKTLLKNGIVVRNRTSQIEKCLRITIGTKTENEQLIKLLKEL